MTHRHHRPYVTLSSEERSNLRAEGRAQLERLLNDHSISRRGLIFGSLGAAAGAVAVRIERALGKTTGPTSYAPAAIKKIFLAPDDHTDYFWTASETDYRNAFLEMLDYYLDLADSTANDPSEFQSRWNCDGSLWLWTYEKNRSPAAFNRLISRIRDGHISVPLNALCVCLGGAPAEAVIRGMYYPGKIERRYNLRFRLAYAMENQTLPYGLGALWAGAGALYSWKGICLCNSLVREAWDREHDIYWWTGPDGSQLLMKWNSMTGLDNQSIGGYAEARKPSAVVDYVDTNPKFIARFAYNVIGAFGQGWDDFKTLSHAIIDAAKAKTIANLRQVIVSNEQDFFEEFVKDANAVASLPAMGCSFGNEWELDSMALAEVFSRVKRAVEKLRGAEALATFVSLKNPSLSATLADVNARDQAWMDLGLYWEHDMGGAPDGPSGPLTQGRIAWQKRLAQEVENYVNTLLTNATARLGEQIAMSGTNFRFFVFNPLSWERTDIADFPYTGNPTVHVVDVTTGAEVPSQIVTVDGQQYLRILASQVPSVGYKVFEIQSGAGQTFPGGPTADAASGVIENELYRVALATDGAITSWLDKTRGNREFVLAGGTLNDLGGASGTVMIENAGPVSATLRTLVSNSTPVPYTTRITLFRGSNRLEIRNDINASFNQTLLWNFSFNLTSPDTWHEEVGAIIHAKLQPDGHYYNNNIRSVQNARYDWLTLNHFADMTGTGSIGVTLSNADCHFMKLGNSTATQLDTSLPTLSVVAGSRSLNANPTGIANQGGVTHFLQRFALQTHDAYDQATAMRFSLEHQNPLITGGVSGSAAAYPADTFSLLTISNDQVLLWALKPADDQIYSGIIARLWNMSGTPGAQSTFTLSLPGDSLRIARHTSHLETPLESLPLTNGALTDTLQWQQLKTYALSPTSLLQNFIPRVFLPVIYAND